MLHYKCVLKSLNIAFIIANSADPDEMQQTTSFVALTPRSTQGQRMNAPPKPSPEKWSRTILEKF